MSKVVKHYPAGNDSRHEAAERSASAKSAELRRRGSDSGNASKHARNMVAKQHGGDPDADTSNGGF